MMYPILTIYGKDDIEVTASDPTPDGTVVVNVERWNDAICDFSHFHINLPQREIVNINYPKNEIIPLARKLFAMSSDILDYVLELQTKNSIPKHILEK